MEPTTNSAMTDILAAFDLATILTFVGTAGVAIVGIALAVKGVKYAKRFIGMS